ncbi:hypothetical protein UPYG_G00127470 [Umbra pygmaea]|uniref:CMP-N-acetylneuraminate-beta-galactosamide-alpha-2,3-sialyltransferase 1 n=1 Tax=Umbra pygmaea TaxID=75934 RepID=A0ABD0XVW7_UMBPY
MRSLIRIRRYILIIPFCITITFVVCMQYKLKPFSNSFVDLLKSGLQPLKTILSSSHCACQKCVRQLDDDPWFQKRFIGSITPFLTRENKTLPSDTTKWWMNLQRSKNPANYSEVVETLFQVIPDVDYKDGGPEGCRTCAVVGNSGNLKGSHYGALIDSSDFIIRMNRAPTSGYEVDVGSRTTHHVMYPESAQDVDNTTSLVLLPFKILDLQWLPGAVTTGTNITFSYRKLRPKINANKDLVKVVNPVFMKYIHEVWLDYQGRYPSTGFMAVILALHICDEVNVYGFGKDKDGNWHHYFQPLLNKKIRTGPHPGDYEYNVTMKLSEINKLQIYKGW